MPSTRLRRSQKKVHGQWILQPQSVIKHKSNLVHKQITTSKVKHLHMHSKLQWVFYNHSKGAVGPKLLQQQSTTVYLNMIHKPIASPVQQITHIYTVSHSCVDNQRAWNWRRWDRRLQREVPPTVLETRGGFKMLSKDCDVVGTSRRGITEWLVRSWLPGRFSDELNCWRGLVELR